jgi:hypothetical protein
MYLLLNHSPFYDRTIAVKTIAPYLSPLLGRTIAVRTISFTSTYISFCF